MIKVSKEFWADLNKLAELENTNLDDYYLPSLAAELAEAIRDAYQMVEVDE